MRHLIPALLLLAQQAFCAEPFLQSELVFPLDAAHNHASTLVELPNHDLYVVWYRGSGERTADDVAILGSRQLAGRHDWTKPTVVADVPGFPDTNPTLFLDNRQRLWLLWQTILANEWHTALTHYRIATEHAQPGPPIWDSNDVLLFVPRDFAGKAKAALESFPSPHKERLISKAEDKYFSRMGWMTRAHPVQLPLGRILIPLYSDGYSFSLIAISDDGGKTWTTSDPIVGHGNIQPSIARKKDGTLVAYMRDNGPPPKRLMRSTSKDDGVTWSAVVDTDIPNPGSGSEVIVLRSGLWALVNNDLERGRHSLAVSLSDDEGASWKWTRHLELDTRGQGAGSFHYPSIIQAQDGTLHVSYSYFLNHIPQGQPRKSIKHAHFNVEWVQQGDH